MSPTIQAVIGAALLLLIPVLLYRGKLRALLFIDLATIPLESRWELVGVIFGLNDLLLLAVILGLLKRRDSLRSISRSVPYLKWWALLGIGLSWSYLAAPINYDYLTDPVRIVYQLYRYCWKPILYYPLVALLFRDPKAILAALWVLVVLGDVNSLPAIPQGYTGSRAAGFFTSANALGALLVVPLIVSAGLFLSSASRRLQIFLAFSFVLMTRALTLTHSRGALIATVFGVAVVAIGAVRSARKRSRLLIVMTVIVVGILVLFAIKPDILERPSVRRALSASKPMEQETFKWRLEQRWPHFWSIAVNHPFLGVGTEVDATLGTAANTPHNGYLGIAVKHGFPVLALYLLFAGFAARSCGRVLRRDHDALLVLLGTVITAGLAALLIHNIDESNFLTPFGANIFWMLTSFAIVTDRGSRAWSGRTRV